MASPHTLPVKILVFDLDGTLVDSARDLIPTLNTIIKEDGLSPIAPQEAGKLIGKGAAHMIRYAYQLHGKTLSETRHKELIAHFLRVYEANIATHTVYFDGVFTALDQMAQKGWQFAICTNKYEHLARQLIKHLGQPSPFNESPFQTITGGDTFSFKKPDPRHIIETIAQAGGQLEHAIMVGDSINDIEAGQKANIPTVAVDFGYTDIPVHAMNPDRIIAHFNELPDAVSSLRP